MPERQHGINCPACGSFDSRVVDAGYLTKELKGLPIRRRIRECKSCKDRYPTIELNEDLFVKLRWPGSLLRNKLRGTK